jgi:SOS-response transcriptional repressor LexA
MFEKLSENLNILMSEIHISADELGRRTGLPSSTIKKIRNHYNPNPTLTTLLPLAQFFSVTLGQLVGSESLPVVRSKAEHQEYIEVGRHIPVLSWIKAISWPSSNEKVFSTITTEHDYSENAYALMVEEDDWENLTKGTALLIDPALKPEHRDFVVVHKEGQAIPTLKQILYDEGQVYLKPLVHGYNVTVLASDHKILGVVVEFKKHLRKQLRKQLNSRIEDS